MPAFSTKQLEATRISTEIEIGERKARPRKRTVGLMKEHAKVEERQLALRRENEKIDEENVERLKEGHKTKSHKDDPHPFEDILVLIEHSDGGDPLTNDLLEAELDWAWADQLRGVLFPEVDTLGKLLTAAANGSSSSTPEQPSSADPIPQ